MKFHVIKSHERDEWRASDVVSRQAFPATGNFDLEANAFGRLAVFNDDIVSPGEGFDMHQHDNMEIFTWVVDGRIAHRDSTSTADLGRETIIERGTVSYINAGHGIRHAEVNADGFTSRQFLRVVQMWILPDKRGTEPSYQTADIREQLASGHIFPVAGPDDTRAPITTLSDASTLYAGVLDDGTSDSIRIEKFTHVYCVRGRLKAELVGGEVAGAQSADLAEGDQLRVSLAEHPVDIALECPVDSVADGAERRLSIQALEPETEVLVWTMER